MAQAPTRRMSAVRERHAAHPVRPRPATKPGEPSSANAPRRGSNRKSGRGANGGEASGGSGDPTMAGGSGGESKSHGGKHFSLPGGKELSLPGGKDISLPRPNLSIWTRLALKIAKRLAKHELRKLAKAASKTLESSGLEVLEKPKAALDKSQAVLDKPRAALDKPRAALEKPLELSFADLKPSLPIQQSVEIGVPLDFAWQKWMELSFLPEGVDKVVEIERDGDSLTGCLAGSSSTSWSAAILDERECESFAWRSTDGSDCAGLVTFHQLSDRLTRIELSLDVVPLSPIDSVTLLTHLADWRARKEMRRFKAELEVISPDVYADDEGSSSR